MAHVKVLNTSKKRVTHSIAGVVTHVKAESLSKEEQRETGRTFAQGVDPDDDGYIDEVSNFKLDVPAGGTVEVPVEVWEHFNRNNAADTFGLYVVEVVGESKVEKETTPDPDAESAYAQRSVADLKDELKARDLPVSGNKAEIVARLEADDREKANA